MASFGSDLQLLHNGRISCDGGHSPAHRLVFNGARRLAYRAAR